MDAVPGEMATQDSESFSESPKNPVWAEAINQPTDYAITVEQHGVEFGADRFPHNRPTPTVATWRMNLTALSQRRNLYFVAYAHLIHVYQPSCDQTLGSRPALILTPKLARPDASGDISPLNPHAVNHVIVGDIGSEEILLLATDSGNVTAYRTERIYQAIEGRRAEDTRPTQLGNGLECLLSEWVTRSAWGLAIHKYARLIAVSSNTAMITIFAFALVDDTIRSPNARGSSTPKPADLGDSNSDWYNITNASDFMKLRSWSRQRRRSQNLRLSLIGHNTNIPSISFVNSDLDPHGDWLASTDINNKLLIWKIWEHHHPVNSWGFFNLENPHFRGFQGHLDEHQRGWTTLVLDPRSFRMKRSLVDACGGTPSRYQSNTGPYDLSYLVDKIEDATRHYNFHSPPRTTPHRERRAPGPPPYELFPLTHSDADESDEDSHNRHISALLYKSLFESRQRMAKRQAIIARNQEGSRGHGSALTPSASSYTTGYETLDNGAFSSHQSQTDEEVTEDEEDNYAENEIEDEDGSGDEHYDHDEDDSSGDNHEIAEDSDQRADMQSPHTSSSNATTGNADVIMVHGFQVSQNDEDDTDSSAVDDAADSDVHSGSIILQPSSDAHTDQVLENTGERSNEDGDCLTEHLQDISLFSKFSILHFTECHVRMLHGPFSYGPSVISRAPLSQVMANRVPAIEATDRFNMAIQIPDLGVVVAASQKGRIAIISLTDTRSNGRVFRIDRILPLASQERKQLRPLCPLLGIAVGPVVPHLIPFESTLDDYEEAYIVKDTAEFHNREPKSLRCEVNNPISPQRSPGENIIYSKTFLDGGLKKEKWHGIEYSRRYRLFLTFCDHTIMHYELYYDWPKDFKGPGAQMAFDKSKP